MIGTPDIDDYGIAGLNDPIRRLVVRRSGMGATGDDAKCDVVEALFQEKLREAASDLALSATG